MAAAFTARGLVKRYGTVTALGGVDLDVEEGELVGLLGPNGAGKSTLVKIGCGLVRATSGEAHVCGARAGSLAARGSMGYLAELFRFPGWATADELLLLHQRLAGSHGGAGERTELLDLVGLADARTRRVEAMSKGMQQRLGIAQALVGTPRFLFLDEPTSALDPGGRRTVRRLLEELRRRGVARYPYGEGGAALHREPRSLVGRFALLVEHSEPLLVLRFRESAVEPFLEEGSTAAAGRHLCTCQDQAVRLGPGPALGEERLEPLNERPAGTSPDSPRALLQGTFPDADPGEWPRGDDARARDPNRQLLTILVPPGWARRPSKSER